MSEHGCGFVCSKAGFWKLLVLVSGGACWALYASSQKFQSPPIKTYILIAYIISWAISLVTYFLKVTGLYLNIQSECLPFSTFDYFWSWLSCMNFISSSVIMACFFSDEDPFCRGRRGFCPQGQQFAALLLGFLTAIFYAMEAQNLKIFAPVGAGYGTTWRGVWKSIILVIGAVAFGLLLEQRTCGGGRRRGNDACSIARTAVLIMWCVAWGVAALIYLIRLITCPARLSASRQSGMGAFEFFWSAFACLLYLIGAAVYAGFLQCSSNQFSTNSKCRRRLAADICGFVTAILFAIDAYYLRDRRPGWTVRRRVRSSEGGREVTTVTTERRTTS